MATTKDKGSESGANKGGSKKGGTTTPESDLDSAVKEDIPIIPPTSSSVKEDIPIIPPS